MTAAGAEPLRRRRIQQHPATEEYAAVNGVAVFIYGRDSPRHGSAKVSTVSVAITVTYCLPFTW